MHVLFHKSATTEINIKKNAFIISPRQTFKNNMYNHNHGGMIEILERVSEFFLRNFITQNFQ